MPDFIADPSQTMAKIEASFERASQDATLSEPEPKTPAKQPTELAPDKRIPSVTDSSAPLLTQSEYWSEFADARSLPTLGIQAELGPGVDYNKAKVKRAIDEIVEFEGPITEDRLASITAARFEMMRVKESRLKSMRELFRHLPRSTSKWGVTYWPSHRSPSTWPGFRTSTSESSRAIEDVPAEELLNAMVAVVVMGDTATEDEILRLLADGHDRKLTEKVRTQLSGILAWGVANGKLTIRDGFYTLP
jgi:hypothetical protein